MHLAHYLFKTNSVKVKSVKQLYVHMCDLKIQLSLMKVSGVPENVPLSYKMVNLVLENSEYMHANIHLFMGQRRGFFGGDNILYCSGCNLWTIQCFESLSMTKERETIYEKMSIALLMNSCDLINFE